MRIHKTEHVFRIYICGEKTMGINGWYLNEEDTSDSSYTDFTYTDLTNISGNRRVNYKPVISRPVNSRTVRNTAGIKPKSKRRKKRSAGRAFLCITGILAIAVVTVMSKDVIVEAATKILNEDYFSETDINDKENHIAKKASEEAFQITAERTAYDTSDPAYGIAENILATLQCDNDIDTAWEIFNWVHSNVYYQPVTESMSFEDAAYRGFTRKSGDCYVYFACSKMLLDCAGIPNLMVERYPVYSNSHYWNLVDIDGEWYHCDATVFKDHPDMYFMCTDEEIDDEHHSFDSSLYPERASGYTPYSNPYVFDEPYGFDDYDYDYYDPDYYDEEVYYPGPHVEYPYDPDYYDWEDSYIEPYEYDYFGEDPYYQDDYDVQEETVFPRHVPVTAQDDFEW